MRAVILIAGRGWWTTGFQLGTKPKCLHHMNGEVLLDYNIRILEQVGIDDIDLVVGYKGEMIEQHVQKNNLKVNVLYNYDWQKSAVHTLKVAFSGEAKDSLLIYGDTLLEPSLLEDMLGSSADTTFMSKETRKIEKGETPIELFQSNLLDSGIFKIGKSIYHEFSDPQKIEDETLEFLQTQFTAFSHANISGGVTLSVMIKLMMLKSQNKDLIKVGDRYKDMDFFYQTDEYKAHPWKLYLTAYPLYRFLQKYNGIKLLKKLKILDAIRKVGALFK